MYCKYCKLHDVCQLSDWLRAAKDSISCCETCDVGWSLFFLVKTGYSTMLRLMVVILWELFVCHCGQWWVSSIEIAQENTLICSKRSGFARSSDSVQYRTLWGVLRSVYVCICIDFCITVLHWCIYRKLRWCR